MLIYHITSLVTGLSYVGKTGKTLDARWAQHVSDARNGSTNYLHRAIKKYGSDSFLREIVCECPEDSSNFWESFCILAFSSRSPLGYNMTDGGDGVPGYIFTEEDRQKLGSGLRGKKRPPRSEEWIEKIRASALKQKSNPDYIEKFRAGCKRNAETNLGWKQKLVADGARRASDPNWHAKISEGVRKSLQDPEVQARRAAAMVDRSLNGWAEKMAVRSATPDWVTKQKEGAKRRSQSPEWKASRARLCADPAYRAMLSKAQKLRNARSRFEKYLANASVLYSQAA